MEQLTFKAFRATSEPDLCAEFLNQHRKVLEDFGIPKVTTNNDQWISDPDTYVIVAISDKEGMVGGIRVEIARGDRELPIESALYEMDHRIKGVVQDHAEFGTAEVCGLWNANRYSSKGLPLHLAFCAVSLANQLGIHSMVCLVAHYTLRHALKAGFVILENIGEGGTFTYPIPSIKAIAMAIPNVITLHSPNASFRQQLFSLRLRPNQERLEMLGGEMVQVKYDLCVKGLLLDMTAYRSIETFREEFAATA